MLLEQKPLLLLLMLLLSLLAAEQVTAAATGSKVKKPTGTANYLITASKTVQIGRKYTIGVALISGGSFRSISARLFTVNARERFMNVSVSAERSFQSGGGTWTELQILLPQNNSNRYDLSATYRLSVKIEEISGRTYSNDTTVSVMRQKAATLIQTDKGIYKPGTTLHYRVVTLDDGLKPMVVNTWVKVRDTKGNLVHSAWHNTSWSVPQTIDSAVSEGQLPLSELPNLGVWTIEAVTDFGIESTNFEVREYELPRFTLDVNLPEFVHRNDSSFKVTAAVRYTFSKAVEGNFKVKIGPYNSCRGCKPRYDMVKEFDVPATASNAEFVFNLTEWRNWMDNTSNWYSYNRQYYNAKVEVVFTEKFTGVKKSVNKQLSIYTSSYSIAIAADETRYFLPGVEIPISVSLKRPDNKPFTEATNDTAELTLVYTRRGKRQSMSQTVQLSAAETGTGASVMMTVPSDADFAPIVFKAKITNSTSNGEQSVRVVPYIGYTDDYVEASYMEDGGEKKVFLKRSNGVKVTFLATLAKSQLQTWTRVEVPKSNNGLLELPWNDEQCTECLQSLPEVTLFMLGVTKSGEMVASAFKLDLTRFLPNVTVTSTLPENTGAPQENATIRVAAKPNSFVYLSGIDRSVNLLRKGNDIMRDSLIKQQNDVFNVYRWRPQPQNVNAKQLLQENGLILLSDGFYYDEADNEPSINYMRGSPQMEYDSVRRASSGAMLSSRRNSMAKAGRGDSADVDTQEQSQLRKFFPETMLWSMVRTNDEGKVDHVIKLPDTITSWDITAFGLSVGQPIQTMASGPFRLITQKQFFIRPILPVSIIRGEKFILKVLVFDYRGLKGPLIRVTLRNQSTFTAKALSGQRTENTGSHVTVVLSLNGTSGMAAFELEAKNLTAMNLSISGELRLKGQNGPISIIDTVERSLTVLPEGITVRQSTSILLSLNNSVVEQSAPINFPSEDQEDFVPGSEVLHFTAIGSVLGPAMQNLQKLVRMPSGCGEQNLVNFAPAVSVAQFARTAGIDDNSAMVQKARRAMQTGYQRQLTFKRRADNLYSAFGDRDPAGSVWLTAFTLSTFARAADFISVDGEAVTGPSLRFLLNTQAANGAFKEPKGGRVFDAGLQGEGESGSIGMTAFVCSALLDIQQQVTALPALETTSWKEADIRGALQKCLWHLKEAAAPSAVEKLDAFDTALSAYTLARAKMLQVSWEESMTAGLQALRDRLGKLAVAGTNGGTFWRTKTSWGSPRESVEATAYALMNSVVQDKQNASLSIVRWLSSKQTDIGGFSTTQATVVGIRALTEFAEQFSINADANAAAVASIKPVPAIVSPKEPGAAAAADSQLMTFSFNSTNRWVLRQAVIGRGQLARVPRLAARGNGTGTVLFTISSQYNIRDPASNPKQLGADWISDNGLALRLGEKVEPAADGPLGVSVTVCVRADANLTSGMYILTVANPSGHSVSAHSQLVDADELQRVEAGTSDVVFYFSKITTPICVYAQWQRDVAVLNTAPQVITLQKYYKAEEKITAYYSAPELQSVTKCQACPDCPDCAAAAAGASAAAAAAAAAAVAAGAAVENLEVAAIKVFNSIV